MGEGDSSVSGFLVLIAHCHGKQSHDNSIETADSHMTLH